MEVCKLPDYMKMYAVLCSAVDKAIEALENIPPALPIAYALRDALEEAEDIYISTAGGEE